MENPAAFVLPCLVILAPLPFVIATRPSAVIRAAVLATQTAAAWWVTGTYTINLGDPIQDYAIACFLYPLPLMHCLHLYFFTDPLTDGTRHVHDIRPAQDMPFWRRVWWATCLATAFRGIGWSNQIAHCPPMPKSKTRGEFIAGALRDLALFVLLADIVDIYNTHNPIMSYRAAEAQSIRSQGVLFQSLSTGLWAINIWANVQVLYCLTSILFVGLGWSEPRFWPRMCGDWRDAYTVGRTWSRVWHQMVRRFVASSGKVAARVLGCPSGSTSSRNAQLLVGFFASGFIHNWGDRMIGQTFGRSTPFFLAQAFAIMFEDAVIAEGRRAGVKESMLPRMLGYVWTGAWFVASVPLLLDVVADAGRPRGPSLPGSPLLMLSSVFGLEHSFSMPWPEARNSTSVYY